MGYATPAAICVKLANPGSVVVAMVGDGDFLMTCMESLTARALGLGILYCV
jgi:acetolactate synthase I/II/III large subunit